MIDARRRISVDLCQLQVAFGAAWIPLVRSAHEIVEAMPPMRLHTLAAISGGELAPWAGERC
jgi:hypothetical protein